MSRLRYEDTVPLNWRPLEALPADQALVAIARDNERLLHLLPVLEGAVEHVHDDEPPSRHAQLMELRLQLLTELLAELLVQTRPLPSARPLLLTADTIEWIDDEPPAEGEAVMASVFLNRFLPRPLRLPAVIDSVRPETGGHRVHGRLQPLGDAATVELEKLIFRQHRRTVASLRRKGG